MLMCERVDVNECMMSYHISRSIKLRYVFTLIFYYPSLPAFEKLLRYLLYPTVLYFSFPQRTLSSFRKKE